MATNEGLKERARHLVSTSVDDLRSSLPYYTSESENNIQIIEFGLEICNHRGEKTKAKMLSAKLRKMKKEVEKERYLRLLQQAYD